MIKIKALTKFNVGNVYFEIGDEKYITNKHYMIIQDLKGTVFDIIEGDV